jgi:hypothetical protein
LAGCLHPLEGPLVPNSCFGILSSPQKHRSSSTWGCPLVRIATVTNEFRCAIKNSQVRMLSLSFSARCCVKNTQMPPAGLLHEIKPSQKKFIFINSLHEKLQSGRKHYGIQSIEYCLVTRCVSLLETHSKCPQRRAKFKETRQKAPSLDHQEQLRAAFSDQHRRITTPVVLQAP